MDQEGKDAMSGQTELTVVPEGFRNSERHLLLTANQSPNDTRFNIITVSATANDFLNICSSAERNRDFFDTRLW